MKLIKSLGLAMVAAITAMAFIGVSSASAAHQVVACATRSSIPFYLCSNANSYRPPSGGHMTKLYDTPTGGKAELKNNAFFKTAEKCDSSFTVDPEGGMGLPWKQKVTSFTFTACEGPCKKAEAKFLPWVNGEVTMTTDEPKTEAENTFTQTNKEDGWRFSECTFGTECEYGVPTGGSITLEGSNDEQGGVAKANGVTLKYLSGSGEFTCGSTETWTATYHCKQVDLYNSLGQLVATHEPCFLELADPTLP